MKLKPIHVFLFLSALFLVYSFSIYLTPINEKSKTSFDIKTASEGRLVWQKYNCQSCHQLYGLGGYLGPDLTNIYSVKGKGELWIKALLKSGTTQMPSFHLTLEEENKLIEFLKSTDASGLADPRQFNIKSNGMIERK
ncbi:c-type cytochrome [Aurantibacillus circumpalustris]|uniref:c-type cytochrome n=1 Tax=Aurantibacillus circumpalustris TaxID=3036359 RepID=UPI00295C0C5B|nr:cytochrome c [Aurantibacillus circumpalustris]